MKTRVKKEMVHHSKLKPKCFFLNQGVFQKLILGSRNFYSDSIVVFLCPFVQGCNVSVNKTRKVLVDFSYITATFHSFFVLLSHSRKREILHLGHLLFNFVVDFILRS